MNTQILQEAAEWLVELNSDQVDSAARERFDAWLRTSPEHVRAYLELLPAWEVGTLLPMPRASDLTVDELIAMGKGAESNVISLPRLGDRREVDDPGRTVGRQQRGSRSNIAIAASLFFACALAAGFHVYSQRGVYVTGIGEQRAIQLEDGSLVELNSRSKVRVRYDDRERNVDLVQGQALFNVAHDAQRPFVVATDRTTVRAVGTQFDVYRKSAGTVVTVVEGRVAVAPVNAVPRVGPTHSDDEPLRGAPEVLLAAGEQLTVAPAGVPTPRPVNTTKALAWTQHRLVFEASTLAEVVEEFNRYNTRQLVLKDPALARFPITAAFSSPDPASLIRFLRTQPEIDVEETQGEILLAQK